MASPLSLAERCAEELADRWAAGERPGAEHFFAQHPHLRRHPEAALELIAEEIALRADHGEEADPADFARRYPEWAPQIVPLFEAHFALAPPPPPGAGDRLGPFLLNELLGSGARGRVFRATQPDLADRAVVLKVGPADEGAEHLSLARLQHSHIVPLYSVHEFPERRLRGLCMPDFGGDTLAAVIARAARLERPDGRTVLAVAAGDRPAAGGPSWAFLERAGWADAVCWVGAALADALQYAHDRGLLHLDVKPTNVLVAADGVPMLLDFHLARGPLRAGDPPPAWLGGTPGYMPPECEAALDAVRAGAPTPAVDGRADVYSLGITLREFLRAGSPPGESPALDAMFERCAAADPARRYPAAGDVAADLRRHLASLPLKGVRNRSLRERWRKWRRRRPLAPVAAFGAAALAALAGGAVLQGERLAGEARRAVGAAEVQMAAGRYAEASETLRTADALAEGAPFRAALRSEVRAARRRAEKGAAADELHALVEAARPLLAGAPVAPGTLDRADEIWAKRAALAEMLAGQATPERDARWRADLLELAALTAARRGPGRLAEAETLLGSSPGGARSLLEARRKRESGAPAEALALADAAVAAGGSAWGHYERGAALLALNRPAEAAAAFGACAALAPGAAWCVYNRGAAFEAAGEASAARADYDAALRLDPGFAAAYAARAGLLRADKQYDAALADLRSALSRGFPPAEGLYRAAAVRLAAGDREGARRELAECLRLDPAHAAGRELMGKLGG